VSGTEPLTYEWKKGLAVVASGSTNYYSKANAQIEDGGTYTIAVTNAAGTATSSAFTVTVNPKAAPSFYGGPSSATIRTGDYFSLAAYDSSVGSTYQWYKDDVAIAGATSNSYYKWEAVAADAGNYKVVGTNSAGSATSPVATITILPPLPPSNLTLSSSPITVTTGEALNIYYHSLSGTGPFTYQWRKDGTDIPGATSSSYHKASASAIDTGSYSLVVTNSAGSVTSLGTTVSVSTAQLPIITYHPTSITVYPGNSLSLSVNAQGTGNLTYQWKKDGVIIPNGTSNYLFVSSSATASDGGSYTVTVSNTEGTTTSQPAVITVLAAVLPSISRQPSSVSIVPEESINLSVEATGYPTPTYQWKKGSDDIPGAVYSTYWKSPAVSSDSGDYSVVVTNSVGSVTSQTAAVSVGTTSAPVILGHPASASLLLGQSFSLDLYHAWQGTTVQWYRNGVAIPNATSSSYSIYSAQPVHAGTYKAVVTNNAGQSSTSFEGVITVDLSASRPVIVYTSGSQVVRGGGTGVASISVSPGLTDYTIVWKKDGIVVPNATSTYLNMDNFSSALNGTYTAEVTAGSSTHTSQPVILSLQDSGVIPRIVTHPASLTRKAGEWASFGIVATGEQPLTYQWKKDGAVIPNATFESYNIQPTSIANAGGYTVVVTNAHGSTTSDVASLSIIAASSVGVPILSNHPASQTLTTGNSSLSLNVSLLNYVGNETYKWYKDGVQIPGTTGSNYWSSSADAASMAGRYKVAVTNSAGTTTSDEAVISVTTRSTGPSFTTQPLSQSGYTGSSVTFSAAATSSLSITYQWAKDGAAISGANSSSLTLSNLTASSAGGYTLVAADADGSVVSSVAQLTVIMSVAPTITTQPTSQVGGIGGDASFTVTASGTPTPTYQWKKNSADIPGATNATLSLNPLATTHEGSYVVVVSNAAGSVTSNSVSLTVFNQLPYAPTITSHPSSGSYAASVSVSLNVGVTGLPSPSVQWYKNGAAISGAQSTTLNLGQMTSAIAGQYYAVATNVLGSATSNTATISLNTETERLMNVSSRGVAGKDSNTLIAGFVISGSGKKNVLLRAVGPTLIPLGVATALTNPRLQLFKGSTVILDNDDWSSGTSATAVAAASTRLGAHPLASGTKDAALLISLDPGVYTAHVTTNDASTGVALLEVYDADETGESRAKVVNLSSRGPVGRGDDVMIVGFVINGSTPKKVLIRGVGPALTALGVTGALVDPKLQLFKGATVINENDNWSSGADANDVVLAATASGALGLPLGSKDAAILVSLPPGVYSAHVRGVADTIGVALMEVYEVP
jgi:hypothetical protein